MAWKIDPTHTNLEFSAKHMMITTVRGRFTRFDGTVTVDPDTLLGSSVEGTIEVASLDTHDSNRDAHLRSGDFFEVEKYPKMTFRSTRVEKGSSGRFRVAGDLTIKETTREVVFEVSDEGKNKDPWGNLRWGLRGETSVNRKDFGLTWNVALEAGGWLVGDQIKIGADLELIYVPEPVAKPVAEAVFA